MPKIEFHSFWCPVCGNKAMDLPRNYGHQHKDFHLKKLWCPHCKQERNTIECKDDEDVFIFKLNFEEGAYSDG